MSLDRKGMTIVSEALLAVGIILVSMAFVMVGGNIVSFQTEGLFASTQNQMPAEISGIIENFPRSSGEFSTTYEPEIDTYTLQVQENRTITTDIPDAGRASTEFLDYRIQNTVIRNSNEICIRKKGTRVSLSEGSCNTGNLSTFCKNGRCINGKCQPSKGETCANAGDDCKCPGDAQTTPASSTCKPNYKAESFINASGSGDGNLDATQPIGCVEPEFIDSQSKKDKCEYDFECDSSLNCNSATSSSGLSGNYCCPSGQKYNGSSCIDSNTYDIVVIPMSYDNSDISSFQSISQDSFEYFRDQSSPFKSCSTPSSHTKAHIAGNANGACDIESTCDPYGPSNSYLFSGNSRPNWQGCWAEMRDCANEVYGSTDWDSVVAMNKGNGFGFGGLAKSFSTEAAIVDDAPEPTTEETFSHEIGHTLGLRHINPDGASFGSGYTCQSATGACNGPNEDDCYSPPSLTDRKEFIMSYCDKNKFGPEGYQHMRSNTLKPYLGSSC